MGKPIKIKPLDNAVVKLSNREKEIRENLMDFVQGNLLKAQSLFDTAAEVDPMGALKILVSMAEFVAPKYSRIKLDSDFEKPTDIVVTFRRPEEEKVIDTESQ